jgi:acyl-[acyl carrier protein]--UDP-N-acetylglucosamine O-acyltransferase
MIGGLSKIVNGYSSLSHGGRTTPRIIYGLNKVGMRRAGFSTIRPLPRTAPSNEELFRGGLLSAQAVERLAASGKGVDPAVGRYFPSAENPSGRRPVDKGACLPGEGS